ncbi:MAG: sugar ABC transporter permease [Alphaproteobacteria bacterium]|nr:sugar ABC transporter permease [Alphaproteobacteria bacterium]
MNAPGNPNRLHPMHLAMIVPVQALLIATIFLPSIYVFWLSLNESSFGVAPKFVGLRNYVEVLSDPYFWRAFVNTAIVINIVVYVELALGMAMALLFATGIPFRKTMISIVLAPYAISEVAAVVMWRFMLDPSIGMVSQTLTALGLPTIEWSVVPAHGLAVVCALSVWLHLPFTFLILYAARLAIPADLYEAARIDGASPWKQFVHITVPVLMPAILVAVLFRYIFAFRMFSEVWLVTGGGPARSTEVLAVYLYQEAFRYNEFGIASATGWLMVAGSILLAIPYLRSLYKRTLTDA